jgi:hypothetical protein
MHFYKHRVPNGAQHSRAFCGKTGAAIDGMDAPACYSTLYWHAGGVRTINYTGVAVLCFGL